MSTPPTVPYSANPTDPELVDVLNLWKKDVLLGFNCHHVATVTGFNPTQQTCQATINYQQTYFELDPDTGLYVPVLVPYPVLVDCPAVVLSGAGGAITFGDLVGQECLVLFNDRDINNWFAGNKNGAVATSRLHSFADGFILVGVRSLANVLTNYDTVRTAMRSRAGETVVAINPVSHKVLITNVYPTNAVTLNTLLAQLVANVQALVAATAAITVTGVTSGGSVSGPPSNAGTITAVATALNTTVTAIAGLLE